MNIEKFENFDISDDDIIRNSNIQSNIKDGIMNDGSDYEYESDFMFGFIESLIKKGYCTNFSEDDDFEYMCYNWFVKYFSKYLTGLKSNIFTESGYPLFTPDGTYEGEELKDLYKTDKELDLSTDYNILNKIKGKLYF